MTQDEILRMAREAGLLAGADLTSDRNRLLTAGLERFAALVAARQPAAVGQEPVAWQYRLRPTWGGGKASWGPWEPCTKGTAEDCWKTPLLHDWAYEARALYTVPQPARQPLTDKRVKVKLGSQYGSDLAGHWFYLHPADEYAEAVLDKRAHGIGGEA